MRSLRESMASTLSTPLAAISSATSRITHGGTSNTSGLQPPKQIECCVKFLDGTHHVFLVEKTTTGAELLKNVVQFSGIGNASKHCFGLQLSSTDSDTSYVKWLDDNKIVAKQVKRSQHRPPRRFRRRRSELNTPRPKLDDQAQIDNNQSHLTTSVFNGDAKSVHHTFQFGVRFYPVDPTQIHDEYARYLVFLQLRRDLAAGRLRAPTPTAALLCSFIVQAELGDFDAGEHTDNSTPPLYNAGRLQGDLMPPHIFDNSSSSYADFISKVQELHQTHAGQTPADAELSFLQEARKLPSYGIFSVRARDTSKLVSPDVIIGVSHSGVLVFRAATRTDLVDRVAEQPIHSIDWAQIVKISFKRKQFVIEVQDQIAPQPQIVVTNGGTEEDAHRSLDLPRTAELIGSKSSGHRHLHAHSSNNSRRRRRRDRDGSTEPDAAVVTQYRGQRSHQQLDSGLHSTSTVSSSGCSTSTTARGGSNNSRGGEYCEHSSRSSSVYSTNRESDGGGGGGGTTAGCFVNMVSIAKLRGAVTKQSIRNNFRLQTRRLTTDSGDSGGSEIHRRNEGVSYSNATEANVAARDDNAELSGLSLQQPTTTFTYILESPQACKALWKQCIEKHTFYRLESPEREDRDATGAALLAAASSSTTQCDSVHSNQQHLHSAAGGSAPRMLLQNLMSLGSRLRQSGGSGRFQQHRYYHHHGASSSSPRTSLQAARDGRVSSSINTSFRNHFDGNENNSTNEIRFIRSSGFKSRLSRAVAAVDAPASSSSPSSATTPTANKHILLNNNSAFAEHDTARSDADADAADTTLVFMQSNKSNNHDNNASDDNLTPLATAPAAVLDDELYRRNNSPAVLAVNGRKFSSKSAFRSQQESASRQAIIISSPALSKFNALTNFCRRTVNFIASSSSSQTLSAYAASADSTNSADNTQQVPNNEAADAGALQQTDAVPLRSNQHAWSLMSSHHQYGVTSSQEAVDAASSPTLNNQLGRKHVEAGAPPPNNRQASSASLPVGSSSAVEQQLPRQVGRRDSPLLGGGIRNVPKNTNIVWAQQRKAQQQQAALLFRQHQTAAVQQQHHSRQASPEKTHRSIVSITNSPAMMEKITSSEVATTVAINSNNCSPVSASRKNSSAATKSSPVAALKAVSIETPPVARAIPPLVGGPAVWQLNNASPSKGSRQRLRDAEQQQDSVIQRSTPSHTGVVRSRSMNYNIDTTTTLSAAEPAGMTTTMLSTSVEIADHTDNSCSVSPSADAIAASAVSAGNCRLLLKERRGMSVRKNHLPPLRLPNASISDAFRCIAADQQLLNSSSSQQSGGGGAGPLVCCRLKPDAEGRFGFNVRGGVDLRSAVIVTRVVPHSPADMAEPTALREGDEILSINNMSTHQRSHEEVVTLIKESWKRPATDTNSVVGILELVVRPNTFYDYAEFERCGRPGAVHNQHHHHHHHHHHRPSVAAAIAVDPSLLSLSLPSFKPSPSMMRPSYSSAYQQQTPPSAAVTPLGLPSPLMHNENATEPMPSDDSVNPDAPVQPDFGTLHGSMQILRDLLVEPTTALTTGFEQIYRKNPDMHITCARLAVNIPKNRYRDVLPYDETRVLLLPMMTAERLAADLNNVVDLIKEEDENDDDVDEGDYVNANYIKMVVPKTGVVNHYIATQGPLASTTNDFWRMVWQEDANLIVMLTQLAEQGRPKCHQYWPALRRTLRSGMLNIVCNTECLIYDDSIASSSVSSDTSSAASPTPSNAFACRREFVVINRATHEERQVTHLQYMTWPDHGVPSHDSIHFLQFVQEVRMRRAGHELGAPTIIHCSAGIGRTGVLILMETAMCLIEAGEPVEPVGIVQCMRDQRGMLIQTPAQYEFVLHCIVRAFDEKLVQPLSAMPPPPPTASVSAEMSPPVVDPTPHATQAHAYSSFLNDSGDETSRLLLHDAEESSSLSSSLMPKLANLHIEDEVNTTPAAASSDLIPTYFAQMHQIHPATPLVKNMNMLCSNNSPPHSENNAAVKQINGNSNVLTGAGNEKNEQQRVFDMISSSSSSLTTIGSGVSLTTTAANGGGSRKPPISSTFYCSADL